jgi:hypothetical protein
MSDLAHSYLTSLGIDVDEETLEHYGKKGMRWGVRHDPAPSGGSGGSGGGGSETAKPSRKERKAAKNQAIEDARERQRMRNVELERQAFKTYMASGEKAAEAAVKKYDKMQLEMITHPDATTAAKMTSGEKAAAAVSWGIVGGLAAASIGLKLAARR